MNESVLLMFPLVIMHHLIHSIGLLYYQNVSMGVLSLGFSPFWYQLIHITTSEPSALPPLGHLLQN